MKVSFFEKENTINQEAFGAGVYRIKIGLTGAEKGSYLTLYIGESYSMIVRCSNHLYEVFCKDSTYFGLKKEHIENDNLELVVEVYETVDVEGKSHSERDIALREREKKAIHAEKPLSQLENSDNLRKDRVKVVSAKIDKLLNNN